MRFDILVPGGPIRSNGPLYRPVLPRGAAIVANRARTELGWDVTVYDGYSTPSALAQYLASLEKQRPHLVGLACHGGPSLPELVQLMHRIRSKLPRVPLVVGGNLPSVAALECARVLPGQCVILSGDPNATDLAMCMDVASKSGARAEIVTGHLAHSWDYPPDLSSIFGGFQRYLRYPDFEYHLDTQRGCPFRCFHCGTGRPGQLGRVTYRALDSLADEISQLRHQCRIARLPRPPLWIADETFFSDPSHSAAVCTILGRYGKHWRAQTRPDTVTPAAATLASANGCSVLALGVEIPVDRGLTLLGKRERMDTVRDAFRNCRTAHLKSEAILVVGADADPSTAKDKLDAITELRAHSVQSYIYHPVPGSPWWPRSRHYTMTRDPLRFWRRSDFHSPPLGRKRSIAARVIAEFLTLQCWDSDGPSPTKRRRTPFKNRVARVVCPTCDTRFTVRPLIRHDAGHAYWSVSGKRELWVAIGKRRALRYARISGDHENILSKCASLRGVPRLMGAYCPRCHTSDRIRTRMTRPKRERATVEMTVPSMHL